MIRIKNKFKELEQKKQKAFGVFLTAGYPSLEYSKNIFKKILDAKVDFIEIGLPFSDPMADGPLIQHSSQTSLNIPAAKRCSTSPPQNVVNISCC